MTAGPLGPLEPIDLDAALPVLLGAVDAAAAATGRAHVVVPGGRSPARLFAALVARGLPDGRWRVHLSDERCVPADHPRRNAPAVARALGLDRPDAPTGLDAPPALDDDLEAARRYAATFAAAPGFAAVVLGLGSDGHVASLFPGDAAPFEDDAPDALVVAPRPGVPEPRITLSARRLSRTALLLLVVDGPDKDGAVDALLRGDAGLPAASITAPRRVLLDLRG